MKKVLLVATMQSHIAQFHKPLINMLKEDGYIVDIAAKNNLDTKNGLRIENVDNVYNINFSRSPTNRNNIEAYKRLKNLMLKNNYDIIHCNTPMGGVITRLIKKNNNNIKAKIIYTAHGFHFYKGSPLINWLIYYPIEKYLSKYTDVLITINEEDYNIAKRKFRNTCVERIHSTGIDINKFQMEILAKEKEKMQKELRINEKEIVILNIGELNKNKNQIMQLKAMKKLVNEGHNNIKLFICGNGPLKEDYEKFIQKNKLEKNIFLLGYRTDINKLLQIADCVVSTSLREGLPINILEAMASETPIIATKNRGHNELIENEKNGYLVDKKNVKELAEKFLKIKQIHDVDSIKEYQKVKVQTYSKENVKEELEKIYNSLGV